MRTVTTLHQGCARFVSWRMAVKSRVTDVTTCGRCGRDVVAAMAETCWYCIEDLCSDCWDEYGHCGHAEADETNRLAARRLSKDEPVPCECENCVAMRKYFKEVFKEAEL